MRLLNFLKCRYFKIISHFLLAICGIVILILHESHDPISVELVFFTDVIRHLLFISNIIIPLGILSVVFALFVCWRIIFEKGDNQNRIFLLLLCVISALLTMSGYIYKSQDRIYDKAQKSLQTWVKEYHDRPEVRAVLDYIQTKLECCGFRNVDDWYYHANGIPPSCCIINFTSKDMCSEENVFPVGCSDLITDLVSRNQIKYSWLLVKLVGVLIIMFLSLILEKTTTKERKLAV